MKYRSTQRDAVRLLYSYSHKDEALRIELEKHLSVMRRNGIITDWHDRRIVPGELWEAEISRQIETAQMIVLLISPDFMASDYCYETEMTRALERHRDGDAVVIPVLLRPVDWKESPLAALQALPRDARPVTTWSNIDEALLDVAQGIGRAVEAFRMTSGPRPLDLLKDRPRTRRE